MKKVLLCILDGIGLREESKGNAFKNAYPKTINKLIKEYPNIEMEASGEFVGLPKGQMGNSEVGHSTIGTGRIIYQSLEKINRSINDGSFSNNDKIIKYMKLAKEKNKIHLIGLLSDGGIHSNINHLFSLLEICKSYNIENVYIHIITDGRDTAPDSGIKYIRSLKNKIKELGIGKIASIAGRYYMMDRDNNYDRVKLAYDNLVLGNGPFYLDVEEAWYKNQDKGITDEFIEPSIIDKDGIIRDDDVIITYNFRPDRLRELYTWITNKEEVYEDRKVLNNIKLLTMMPVDKGVICENVFSHENITNSLGEVIANNKLKQLRIAETEKYAHVTYFFDGGKELELDNCDKILIPSPKVATYDLQPEMSAYQITDKLLDSLNKKYDLIILNYANGDMVGHTGVYDKGIEAVKVVDECLDKIINNFDLNEYTIIITADHGNCEEMINEDGTINTAHTTNKVPFIILDKNIKFNTMTGKLSDIAPTILKIMDIDIPKEMNGNILIK